MRGLVVCGLLAWCVRAEAGKERFLGFSPDQTYWMVENDYGPQRTDGSTGYTVCKASGLEATTLPSWAEPADGERCYHNDDSAEPRLPELGREMVTPRAGGKKGKLGFTLSLSFVTIDDRPSARVVLHKGKDRIERFIEHEPPRGKLGKVYWRPDGTAVVFEIVSGRERTHHGIDLGRLGPPAATDPARAKLMAAAGARHFTAGDRHAAHRAYLLAAGKDPSDPRVQLALAALSSWLGDFVLVRSALGRAMASADPKVRAMAGKLFTVEAMFDRASTEPELRALMGLPPWAELGDRERVLERSFASWSIDAADCDARAMTLVFEASGNLAVTSRTGCDAKGVVAAGRWAVSKAGQITIDITLPGGPALARTPIKFVDCLPPGVPSKCLTIGSKQPVGPFHRGSPVLPVGAD